MAVSPRCSSALALLALATSSLGAQTETPSAAFVPNQASLWAIASVGWSTTCSTSASSRRAS